MFQTTNHIYILRVIIYNYYNHSITQLIWYIHILTMVIYITQYTLQTLHQESLPSFDGAGAPEPHSPGAWKTSNTSKKRGEHIWTLYGDFMVMLWWCYGDFMVILWWFYGDVMVMLWWFYGDLKEFNWWCNGISNHGLFLWVYVNWRDWTKYRVNLISAMNDGYGSEGWDYPHIVRIDPSILVDDAGRHVTRRSDYPGFSMVSDMSMYVHGCMSLFVCKSTVGYRIDSSECRRQILYDPMHVVSQETSKHQSCSNPGLPPWLSETEAAMVRLCTFGSGASIVMWKHTMKPEETTNQKHLSHRDEKAALARKPFQGETQQDDSCDSTCF